MTLVIFDPEAQAEFLDAVRYYEECQEGLGRRFRFAIESATKHISEATFLYRILKAPFRRYLLAKFPYSRLFTLLSRITSM